MFSEILLLLPLLLYSRFAHIIGSHLSLLFVFLRYILGEVISLESGPSEMKACVPTEEV